VADVTRLQETIQPSAAEGVARQPKAFFRKNYRCGCTLAATTGECKQGMDIKLQRDLGYAPLIRVAAPNTKETLYLVNRPGNQTSASGAESGLTGPLKWPPDFDELWLRGDTDFSLTEHLDKWDQKVKSFWATTRVRTW